MKKSNYFLYLFSAVSIVLLVYGLMHAFHLIQLPMKLFILVNTVIPLLFVGGAAILTVGKKKNPESFAQRFMLMTTFQLLTILSIIAAIWYKANIHLKSFGLQFVSVFVILMIFHSLLLVRLGAEEK